MSYEAELALDQVLRRQHGAFSRQQAIEAGFTPRMIDRRVTAERWRRLDHGIYRHPAHPVTWHQRCHAALLTDPRAVLGGRTAAVVHGLVGFRPGRIEITVPPAAHHGDRLARVRRSALIESQVVDGLRVNSLALSLVEVAGVVSERRLERALEDAVLNHSMPMSVFVSWYLRLADSRRPGLGKLRRIIDQRVDGFVPAESELEAMLFEALDTPELPPITRQAPFPWSPRSPQRVDAVIDAWGVVLEADGRRWHARLETMEADRRRDQEAIRHGYLPLRFGWSELHDDPARVRAIVLEAGRHRSSEPIDPPADRLAERGR
jgi:very-short-patch-repair endonuclease